MRIAHRHPGGANDRADGQAPAVGPSALPTILVELRAVLAPRDRLKDLLVQQVACALDLHLSWMEPTTVYRCSDHPTLDGRR